MKTIKTKRLMYYQGYLGTNIYVFFLFMMLNFFSNVLSRISYITYIFP